jgi:hypothetical protein
LFSKFSGHQGFIQLEYKLELVTLSNIPDDANWMLFGDFNFYRFVESRNQLGAKLTDIKTFNDIICYLGLVELPIKCCSFTWSSMQMDPLLV